MLASSAKIAPKAVSEALAACRFGMIGAVLISMVMNILVLTGPFYMLQIYDRVLPGHSIPTLLAFSVLALLLFCTYGGLDFARTRLMSRLGAVLDLKLADAAFKHHTDLTGTGGNQALKDLATVRQFLAGPAAVGLLDVPWLPLYMSIIFLLHPVIGYMSVGSAVVFLCIAALNEMRSKPPARTAELNRAREDRFIGDARSNIDTIHAMGMVPALRERWHLMHIDTLETGQRGSDLNNSFAVLSRTLRLILQSSILGLGAYLALQNELSSGALVACSIIFARALAPIDQAVAHWRSILAARESWRRLHDVNATHSEGMHQIELRAPERSLAVSNLVIASPDRKKMIVPNVSFRLDAGDCLAIIGASGAGKSSLIRTLVGTAAQLSGDIRIDGATLAQWSDDARSKYIGYLAQDVQLLDGTVAQNISRFKSGASSEAVILAAEAAGVHDFIVSLPEGYDTVVGPHGVTLSAGQKQRIGLARALFGKPFVLMLDEPNAHLDRPGELALVEALQLLRDQGSISIVAAHRASVLSVVNKLLLLEEGKPAKFGSKDEILSLISTSTRSKQDRNLHVVGS